MMELQKITEVREETDFSYFFLAFLNILNAEPYVRSLELH